VYQLIHHLAYVLGLGSRGGVVVEQLEPAAQNVPTILRPSSPVQPLGHGFVLGFTPLGLDRLYPISVTQHEIRVRGFAPSLRRRDGELNVQICLLAHTEFTEDRGPHVPTMLQQR
jgi:hypothetical protein